MSSITNPSLTDSTAGIYTDFNGLTKLRSQAAQKSPEATEEVAKQFESIFIQMMLKSMRDASAMNEDSESDQTKFYQEMFDKQIALDLASGEGIGLAAVIRGQLGGIPASSSVDDSLQSNQPLAKASATKLSEDMSWTPEDNQSFIREIFPHAETAASELNTSPEVLLAQSALETDWGKKIVRDDNGKTSLNLFTLPADNNWEGERVNVSTIVNRDGISQRERASFRAYDSFADSMNDYAKFLQSNPTSQKAPAMTNSAELNSIMQQQSFKQTVAAIRDK